VCGKDQPSWSQLPAPQRLDEFDAPPLDAKPMRLGFPTQPWRPMQTIWGERCKIAKDALACIIKSQKLAALAAELVASR